MVYGGLVGYNTDGYAEITDCYSTGKVSGTSNIGGLVGTSYGKISNSYSIAKTEGTSSVGGVVGYLGKGTITNSYYSPSKSGIETSAKGSTSLTLDQMKNKNSYTGWNFTSEGPWEMKEFPQLKFKFTIPEEDMQ